MEFQWNSTRRVDGAASTLSDLFHPETQTKIKIKKQAAELAGAERKKDPPAPADQAVEFHAQWNSTMVENLLYKYLLLITSF